MHGKGLTFWHCAIRSAPPPPPPPRDDLAIWSLRNADSLVRRPAVGGRRVPQHLCERLWTHSTPTSNTTKLSHIGSCRSCFWFSANHLFFAPPSSKDTLSMQPLPSDVTRMPGAVTPACVFCGFAYMSAFRMYLTRSAY